MNIVVISEGRTELSKSYLNRDFLSRVPSEELGALETIIARIATDVLKTKLTIMGLPRLPLTRPGHTSRASLTQVIQNPDLLKQMLLPCFNPIIPTLAGNAAQGAIVACDLKIRDTVATSISQLRQSINKKIIQITFKPEFEVLLLERDAIEKAANLSSGSVILPSSNDIGQSGGLKEAFVQCVIKAGYNNRPHAASADFKLKVAKCLSTRYLTCDNPPILELRQNISQLVTK